MVSKVIKQFSVIKPDIITSDYDMPVLNGWEFCTEVRDHEEYKDIPIIMITTRATEMDLKKERFSVCQHTLQNLLQRIH